MALLFVGALSAVALSCRLGFSCFGDRLTAIRYALGLTVATRQDIAYARTASPPSWMLVKEIFRVNERVGWGEPDRRNRDAVSEEGGLTPPNPRRHAKETSRASMLQFQKQ